MLDRDVASATPRRGYTLGELALSVAILAGFMTLVAPAVVEACECRNKQANISRARQIVAAFQMYATDHDQSLTPLIPGKSGYIRAQATLYRTQKELSGESRASVCTRINAAAMGGDWLKASKGADLTSVSQAVSAPLPTALVRSQSGEVTRMKYDAVAGGFHIAPLAATLFALQDPGGTDPGEEEPAEDTAVAVECTYGFETGAPCRPDLKTCVFWCDDGTTHRATFPKYDECPDKAIKR